MLAKCHSGAVCGIGAQTVEIEVCSTNGSPQFTIVGLAGSARVESAHIPEAINFRKLDRER